MRVLGFGELMIQLNPTSKGPLRHANMFERRVAGSEANVIIGMSRLGNESAFFTAVGDDELGNCIISTLNAEKVETKFIKVGSGFTAVYFVERGYPVPSKTNVLYYRKGSAFSKITPNDIAPEMFDNIELIFISGITPALSESCYSASKKMVEIAKEKNIKVVFDTNIRKKLLPDSEIAIKTLSFFIQEADILITGIGDLEHIFPNLSLDDQIKELRTLTSTDLIVFKMGKEGARAYKGKDVFEARSFDVEVVDELGAGDAFDAAFLASFMEGKTIDESLIYGNAAGAIVVGVVGDIEPLPNWKELDTFISFQESGEKRLIR
jgi:sugar/nucleoside kinase (ribokinase family)